MSTLDTSQWYKIMKYIREAPGRVYADELLDMIHTLQGDEKEKEVVDFLNINPPKGLQKSAVLFGGIL